MREGLARCKRICVMSIICAEPHKAVGNTGNAGSLDDLAGFAEIRQYSEKLGLYEKENGNVIFITHLAGAYRSTIGRAISRLAVA